MAAPLHTDAWRSVRELRPAPLLRQYELTDPEHADGAPVMGLDSLAPPFLNATPVPAFMAQLCATGLPFNVHVKAGAIFHKEDEDEPDIMYFSLPPFMVEPNRVDSISDWNTLRAILLRSMEYKIENMEGLPSSVIFIGLDLLRFTFVPLDNLAAFQARLPQLVGGTKARLPEVLLNKKCCLTIENGDEQCLRCCVMSYVLKIYLDEHAKRWGKYLDNFSKGPKVKGWKPIYKDCGINFECLPTEHGASLDDIAALELANPELAIFVYIWKQCCVDDLSEDFPVLRRAPPSDMQQRPIQIILLHHANHWFLVTNFQFFMCQQSQEISRFAANNHNTMHSCHRCMQNFRNPEKLSAHLTRCNGQRFDAEPSLPRLPSTRNPKDKCEVYFKNTKNTFLHNVMVYSDIETYRAPLDKKMGRSKVTGENRHAASIGYHTVAEGFPVQDEFQNHLFVDLGGGRVDVGGGVVKEQTNVFTEYVRSLCRLVLSWDQIRKNQQRIAMTKEAWRVFNEATVCAHCGNAFKSKADKCRDHDHVTAAFRAALCRGCNAKARIPTTIPVGTHNSTNYDNAFYVRGIARLQASAEAQMGIHEFVGLEPQEKDVPIYKWTMDLVATSSEKFKSISFGSRQHRLRWIDTCAFLQGSLAKLMASQAKQHPMRNADGSVMQNHKGEDVLDFGSAFPICASLHPFMPEESDTASDLERLRDLMRKIPFPYSALTGPHIWDEPAVLSREHYFDEFDQEHISNEDYAFMQSLASKCGMRTFRQYHDCYLCTDVLALSDVFESFRRKFHETLGIDPVHYLGIPGAAMDALLKNSGARIRNITRESAGGQGAKLMNDINDNIRGGLSCMFRPHVKANNPKCSHYIPCDPETHTWLIDWDVTSLYPANMCKPLPVGDYRLEAGFEAMDPDSRLQALHHLLDGYTDASPRGYMLIVGFEVPDELHDKFDFAPVVSRQVAWDELSQRQQTIKLRKAMAAVPSGAQMPAKNIAKLMANACPKLVPDLGHRVQGIHIEHAQELRKLGIRFTSVQRVWSYEQARIFQDFISKRAKERGQSTDKCYREIVKILMNSIFGKMLENKLRHCNAKLHTERAAFQRNASLRNCFSADIVHSDVYEDGSCSFLGLTKHFKQGGVVLDTPRMIGWAILEYSKLTMLRYHYNVVKKHFGDDRVQICMTDTDSLYELIRWPTDPVDHMHQLNVTQQCPVFDLSEVPRYANCQNAKRLGCIKYESGASVIEEAIFLASKMYVKKMYNAESAKAAVEAKGKGVPSRQLKRLCNFEAYRNALFFNEASSLSFFAFRHSKHIIKHCQITRQGLTADNDKVFILNAESSRPLGHKLNKILSDSTPTLGWDLQECEGDGLLIKQALKYVSEGVVRRTAVKDERLPEDGSEEEAEEEAEEEEEDGDVEEE